MGWLTNWNRRKQLYLNGSSVGPQSYYQMKITINYGSGTDAAGSIYCGGNCKTDFSDIRFTDINGTTLLNYWVESYATSSNAIVWIQIPYMPTGSNSAYIYFYYNNPNATSSSNIKNTFVLGDDFQGSSLDTNKWQTATLRGAVSVNNQLVLNPQSTSSWSGAGVIAVSPIPAGSYILQATLKRVTGYKGGEPGLYIFLAPKIAQDITYYGGWDISGQCSANLYEYTLSPNNWRLEATYKGTDIVGSASSISSWNNISIDTKLTYNNTNYSSIGDFTYSGGGTYEVTSTGSSAVSPLYPGIHYGDYEINNYGYATNFRVRKYTIPEPIWSSKISVEQNTDLTINSNPSGAEIWMTPHGGTYLDQGIQTNIDFGLIAGTYDIKLIKGGYQDYILSNQSFSTGQGYIISATLLLLPGSLSISSTPIGTEIYLALQPGTPVDQGVTTQPGGTTIPNLSPGTYNIRLTLAGYQDWTGQAIVVTNSTASAYATFAGSAYITSTPSGAAVYLDGSPTSIGTTPLTITNLTPPTSDGTQPTQYHTYILKLTGFADTSGPFTATAGSTITIPITFPGSLYITSIPTGASIYIDGVLQQ